MQTAPKLAQPLPSLAPALLTLGQDMRNLGPAIPILVRGPTIVGQAFQPQGRAKYTERGPNLRFSLTPQLEEDRPLQPSLPVREKVACLEKTDKEVV